MDKILTAVAMIVGTGDFHSVARIGLLVGLLLVLVQALMQGAQKIDFQQVLVAWLLFSGLYGATTTVTIDDAYTGEVRSVANVPYGVAAIGSLVSEVGYGLTETFEQAFSSPSITRNGFADALEVVKRVRINSIDRIGLGYANDPSRAGRFEFEQSWLNYIQNCTIQGIKIGAPLPAGNGTLTDSYIVNASNLLEALRYQNPNGGTKININAPETPTCSVAYDKLSEYTRGGFYNDYLKETLATALGEPKDPDRVETRIAQALDDLGFGSVSAKDFVVTSVLEPLYAKAWAGEHAIDLALSFAMTIENSLNQRAAQWNAEGSMWNRSIRPMITFLEGFVYAVTPFMALVIVMGPFGIRLAGKYLVLLFWIQLWLPTLAITNLYIMMTVQGKLSALAGNGAGLSLTSISGIMNADSYIQEYLATGQMLAASTPMIALMLVSGAAVTATQFASRLQGAEPVDEKKGAPDTVHSLPRIQQQAERQADMQGGLRQQGADAVLPAFGYSAGAMETVAGEDARLRQAHQSFSEGFQRTTANASSPGDGFTSGDYFSSGRGSPTSEADRAALEVGRSVAGSYRPQLGRNFERVANAAAEAALGAKAGNGGILSEPGAFAANLQSAHNVDRTTARALENSLRTDMAEGSAHDAKLTEAIASDYRGSQENYFTKERGLQYDDTLRSAASAVASGSRDHREAVSASRGAGMDRHLTAPAVAQRFAEDPEMRRELRNSAQQLGLGGVIDKYLDGKQGAWLTDQLGGDREKAYDVAALSALTGRAGGPPMEPERARTARDTANGLLHRGFGRGSGRGFGVPPGGFGTPANHGGSVTGNDAPQFKPASARMGDSVGPAGPAALPLEASGGGGGPGGHDGLADGTDARQRGDAAGESLTPERPAAGAEAEVGRQGHGLAVPDLVGPAAEAGPDAASAPIGGFSRAADPVETGKEDGGPAAAGGPQSSPADAGADREGGGGDMPPEGDGGPSVSDTSVNKEPSNLSKPKGTEPSGTESPSWLERNRPLLEMMSLDATPLGFAASGVLAMMDFRKGDVVGGGLNTLGALPVVGAAATISKVGKITNHSEDAVKLAKSLGGERQAAELLGPAAADTGLPFSRIVPGGGLKAHEKASGHSWDWHIGRSESELIERFALEKKKMEASSSFYDQTTAERAIADLLDANAAEISNWLSSPKGKMTLHHTGQNPVGIYVKRGDTSAVDVNSTRAILIRNPSMPTGYHILTGFPQP